MLVDQGLWSSDYLMQLEKLIPQWKAFLSKESERIPDAPYILTIDSREELTTLAIHTVHHPVFQETASQINNHLDHILATKSNLEKRGGVGEL